MIDRRPHGLQRPLNEKHQRVDLSRPERLGIHIMKSRDKEQYANR